MDIANEMYSLVKELFQYVEVSQVTEFDKH